MRHALLFSVAIVFLSAFLLSFAEGPQRSSSRPPIFGAAEDCGSCHTDIYKVWKESVHARAARNPVFQASLRESVKQEGARVQELCLRCHAPVAVASNDLGLSHPVSREGVTCDFCHSLKDVKLEDRRNPFRLDVGSIKRGPIKDAVPLGHGAAYSELHTSALLCASCHEYQNPRGVAVLSTYSEWLAGPYPRQNNPCQGCHMPLVMGKVVDPRVKRTAGAFINLHQMPGGHSKDQLQRSLSVQILELRKSPEGATLRLEVTNLAAGHRVPTGIPSRKIRLQVEAIPEGGTPQKQERVYERVLLDESGRPIERAGDFFTRAAAVARDNRLAPGERRTETFTLGIVRNRPAVVRIRLVYVNAPLGTKESETTVEFFREERRLPR
ncbi:MAG: hypothetical protein HY652_01610 [Acidobacteria bacterium]|nr:hypothetical protein [Acidobacteriota bacterium]